MAVWRERSQAARRTPRLPLQQQADHLGFRHRCARKCPSSQPTGFAKATPPSCLGRAHARVGVEPAWAHRCCGSCRRPPKPHRAAAWTLVDDGESGPAVAVATPLMRPSYKRRASKEKVGRNERRWTSGLYGPGLTSGSFLFAATLASRAGSLTLRHCRELWLERLEGVRALLIDANLSHFPWRPRNRLRRL